MVSRAKITCAEVSAIQGFHYIHMPCEFAVLLLSPYVPDVHEGVHSTGGQEVGIHKRPAQVTAHRQNTITFQRIS